jgi:hypothetical protein
MKILAKAGLLFFLNFEIGSDELFFEQNEILRSGNEFRATTNCSIIKIFCPSYRIRGLRCEVLSVHSQ